MLFRCHHPSVRIIPVLRRGIMQGSYGWKVSNVETCNNCPRAEIKLLKSKLPKPAYCVENFSFDCRTCTGKKISLESVFRHFVLINFQWIPIPGFAVLFDLNILGRYYINMRISPENLYDPFKCAFTFGM